MPGEGGGSRMRRGFGADHCERPGIVAQEVHVLRGITRKSLGGQAPIGYAGQEGVLKDCVVRRLNMGPPRHGPALIAPRVFRRDVTVNASHRSSLPTPAAA